MKHLHLAEVKNKQLFFHPSLWDREFSVHSSDNDSRWASNTALTLQNNQSVSSRMRKRLRSMEITQIYLFLF